MGGHIVVTLPPEPPKRRWHFAWPWTPRKADPEHVAELEAENAKLDEYNDSDGAIPYPDLSGVDRETASGAAMVAKANAVAEKFVAKGGGTYLVDGGATPSGQVVPHGFQVEMVPLEPPKPKKRELFEPPVLDDNYFAGKRRERAALEERRLYRSASTWGGYGVPSHYGGGASYFGRATHVGYPAQGCRGAHVVEFGSDRCALCGESVW